MSVSQSIFNAIRFLKVAGQFPDSGSEPNATRSSAIR